MSAKESKQPKKRTRRTSNVQGSKNTKKSTPPKKVSISFHKFRITVLEATMADLEEITQNSGVSLKDAMGFLLDIGSLGYKGIKARQQEELNRIRELAQKKIEEEAAKRKIEKAKKKVKEKKVAKKEAVGAK